jgi:thiol-disulfide isomerase/thioredoxin
MKQTAKMLLGFSLVALFVMSCSSDKKETAQIGTPSDQMQAQPATSNPAMQNSADNSAAIIPDPSAVQFAALDINGATRQSTEWVSRQPVVINFWGTWCPPCRREIPDLVKFYEEYKPRGLEIVSLAINDNPAAVRAYSANAGMKWVMLMGSDDISQRYGGIRGVPTTIFLDRTGKETDRFVGARSYEDFKQAAEKIL